MIRPLKIVLLACAVVPILAIPWLRNALLLDGYAAADAGLMAMGKAFPISFMALAFYLLVDKKASKNS